jgi:hypothetical protein
MAYGPMKDMTREDGGEPYLCLTHQELLKLDLDDNPDVGDYVHLEIIGRVTNVNKSADPETGKPCCRIELCVEAGRLNEESHPDEDDGPPVDKRLSDALYG